MNTLQNIDSLRHDLRERMQQHGISQIQLEKNYGVDQTILSNFLSGRRGLSYQTVSKLWPFVYGAEFPHIFAKPAVNEQIHEKAETSHA